MKAPGDGWAFPAGTAGDLPRSHGRRDQVRPGRLTVPVRAYLISIRVPIWIRCQSVVMSPLRRRMQPWEGWPGISCG
jgi:hypothetical protein